VSVDVRTATVTEVRCSASSQTGRRMSADFLAAAATAAAGTDGGGDG